jgi:toxin ParE1/3/4
MPARLVWRKRAERQLQSIYQYIAGDNPVAAESYVADILDAIGRLADFPLSGRAFDRRHRVLVVRNHLVIYRHESGDTTVLVSAIIDGRRDVAALMRKLGASR